MPRGAYRLSAEVDAEIHRRLLAGEKPSVIARAVDCDLSTVCVRRDRMLDQLPDATSSRVLRLSDDERAEIDRRLVAGETAGEVAAALGINTATIRRRKAALGDIIPKGLLCSCGKPRGHAEGCWLAPEKREHIRRRTEEGAAATAIAVELGITKSTVLTYARPIIADLRARGVNCRCGKAFAHPGTCRVIEAERSEFVASVEALLREGCTKAEISRRLPADTERVRQAADTLLPSLREDGVLCRCGKQIGHPHSCRGVSHDTRRGIRYHGAALDLPKSMRAKVPGLIMLGLSDRLVCRRLGVARPAVRAIREQMAAAGSVAPDDCPCGLPRDHWGDCAADKPAVTRKKTRARPALPNPKLYGTLRSMFRSGKSIDEMCRATGLSFWKVRELTLYWKEREHLPPCACGRPARHPGSCIVVSQAKLGKRWLVRIEAMILQGRTVRQIGEALDLPDRIVLLRAVGARERLLAEGRTCPCGKPIGHKQWCSETWYRGNVGKRPVPAPMAAKIRTALVNGDDYDAVRRVSGAGVTFIRRVRAALTPAELSERASAVRARRGASGDESYGADLMARIRKAVPERIEAALRDDVVSELYLAIAEGRLEVSRLSAAVKSFVSRGIGQWQSAYGPASLDAPIGADDRRSRADMVEDATALGELDNITIGERDA